MMTVKQILFSVLFSGALFTQATEYAVDTCRTPRNWIFIEGAEFKGARGGISAAPEGIALQYDFNNGGEYVGMRPVNRIPDSNEFQAIVNSDRELQVNYRLTDDNGRTFQAHPTTVKPGEDTIISITTAGPWQSSWGGKDEVKTFTPPVRGFWLTVGKPKQQPLSGKLLVKAFTVSSDVTPPNTLAGEPFQFSGANWKFVGNWEPLLEGATLKLTVTPLNDAKPATLTIIEPRPGRDAATRFNLDPQSAVQRIDWTPAFPAGVNPRTITKVRFQLTDDAENKVEFTSSLIGQLAGNINLGAPKNSLEIPSSRIGTCVHFDYAPKPEGPFAGWNARRELLDLIAACGLKYIRCGVSMEKNADGQWTLMAHSTDTLHLARERGIEQILVIDMKADESIETFLERVQAVVEQTRDFVHVYELGNEPHNFGNWRQKFLQNGREGSWNGYEGKNTVSEWLREFVRYTNAAADRIKEIAPDKIVIGLGSNTPTNFHALNLGVSENLDGVVDHPYTFSMPPEKVPFGWNLTERDGIQVGDAENTFAGLIHSYIEHFRKTGKMRSIWITEFGFPGFWFNGKNENGLYAGFTEEAQAAYLARRFIEGLALPIAMSCQYDFLDDYGSEESNPESNFGLIRADHSLKPAYFVVQRINSLLHGVVPDPAAQIKFLHTPLHRSATRGALIADWDNAQIQADNGIRAYPFVDAAVPNERMLALWSVQPYSREFNNRVVTLEISGWSEFDAPPVAINLMTGENYGIAMKQQDGKFILENLPLKDQPLLIKFFRSDS